MKKSLKTFIPKEELEKEIDSAIEKFSLPGFRKGDVPGILFRLFQDQNSHFNSVVQRYVLKEIFEYMKQWPNKLENYKITNIMNAKNGWNVDVDIYLEDKSEN